MVLHVRDSELSLSPYILLDLLLLRDQSQRKINIPRFRAVAFHLHFRRHLPELLRRAETKCKYAAVWDKYLDVPAWNHARYQLNLDSANGG